MNRCRWLFAKPDPILVAQLSERLRLPPILSRCLANRGCGNVEDAEAYLNPRLARLGDPFLLPGMSQAVDRLLDAHARQEPFVIFGDYDVDGVTATALLTEFFAAFGWRPSHYLPHRMDEGYGLTQDGIDNCLGKIEARLVLAVDCGSTSVEVVRNLRSRGMDTIVLDHHQVSSPAPPALALVNPQLIDGASPLKNLCSAGLAFKLAHGLLKRMRSMNWPGAAEFDLKQFLDLVALGTVADVVPLQGENRIFARIGLERLSRSQRPGIQALKAVAGITGAVGAQEVGYQLAPRLNAAGRLETALDALDLILATDPARASEIAARLDAQNRERRTVEKKIVDEVLQAVRARFNPETDFAIVEGRPEWHIGVVGIVAARVLREFHRPVVILGSDGTDSWRGSGRSIEGFDLASGLRECSDLLLKHGGHAMAAGVTMESPKIDELRARLNELVRTNLPTGLLSPCLKLDGEARLEELNYPCLKSFEKLNPIGQANPPIQFVSRAMVLKGEPRVFGSARQHLRFDVTDGGTSQQAVWWNGAGVELPDRFDLAYTPELNEYNGTLGIQLKVLDIRAA